MRLKSDTALCQVRYLSNWWRSSACRTII